MAKAEYATQTSKQGQAKSDIGTESVLVEFCATAISHWLRQVTSPRISAQQTKS